LLAFPNGRHDDQVDSTSQALDYLTARTHALQAGRTPRERPTIVRRPGYDRPLGSRDNSRGGGSNSVQTLPGCSWAQVRACVRGQTPSNLAIQGVLAVASAWNVCAPGIIYALSKRRRSCSYLSLGNAAQTWRA
jgi:hypothetical protein